MTQTMTVIAPPGGYSLPSYGGGFAGFGGLPGPSQGQLHLQMTLPYFQSTALCLNTANWLVDYVESHGLDAPQTARVVSDNIRTFLNADTRMCHNSRLLIYDAIHSTNPAPTQFNYATMSITQMSGSVVTPIAAFGHYLWGNGETRYVNLSDVGLRITPQQIPDLMHIANSASVGSHPVSIKFRHSTYESGGIIPAAYLGNITLRTEGTLNIQPGGSWNYNGVVRAYNDTYDFNRGDFRGPVAEAMTWLGSRFAGTAYQIALPGEINISGSGHR